MGNIGKLFALAAVAGIAGVTLGGMVSDEIGKAKFAATWEASTKGYLRTGLQAGVGAVAFVVINSVL